MNYIKLDDLDKGLRHKKYVDLTKDILSEVFKFSIFMSAISILVIVFVNFNVFYYAFKERFGFEKSFASNIIQEISGESIDMDNLEKTIKNQTLLPSSDNFEGLKNDKYMEVLESKLDLFKSDTDKTTYEKDMNGYLKSKIKDYSMDFNLLPPDKRIEIPSIEVNAPIIDMTYISPEKIKNADYDEELYKGVVKYPFTPDPDHTGALLIFGHTSYYWWKKNEYGEVFSKIPLLVTGSKIDIVWGGISYKYEVIDKVIKYPNQIADLYDNYKNDKYLILMGCYPIGTDKRRILIIAKQVDLNKK